MAPYAKSLVANAKETTTPQFARHQDHSPEIGLVASRDPAHTTTKVSRTTDNDLEKEQGPTQLEDTGETTPEITQGTEDLEETHGIKEDKTEVLQITTEVIPTTIEAIHTTTETLDPDQSQV